MSEDQEDYESRLKNLSERERHILKTRFGLDPDGDLNVEDPSVRFKIVRAKILAIEERAQKKKTSSHDPEEDA